MDNFEFYRPTKYYFGRKIEENVGSYIKESGKSRVLIVFGGGSCVKSGLLARVEKSLNDLGIFYVEIGGVKPNPRADLVYKAITSVPSGKPPGSLAATSPMRWSAPVF